jgi:hypothetical protein
MIIDQKLDERFFNVTAGLVFVPPFFAQCFVFCRIFVAQDEFWGAAVVGSV